MRSLDAVLGEAREGALLEVLTEPSAGSVPAGARVLCPLESQEVWAAGVTYSRSRDARKDESDHPDHYDRVYAADRPELFAKAGPGRSVGPDDDVGIRADSRWDVPEPELGVLADSSGTVVAYVLGNDMSSRSIEGENPLYLPQAKVYRRSCAVGPCLVPVESATSLAEISIHIEITRDAVAVFDGHVPLTQLRRSPAELVDWLSRGLDFPNGVLLLTGTGIVPPPEFTLAPADLITITGTGLGTLRNTVVTV